MFLVIARADGAHCVAAAAPTAQNGRGNNSGAAGQEGGVELARAYLTQHTRGASMAGMKIPRGDMECKASEWQK